MEVGGKLEDAKHGSIKKLKRMRWTCLPPLWLEFIQSVNLGPRISNNHWIVQLALNGVKVNTEAGNVRRIDIQGQKLLDGA